MGPRLIADREAEKTRLEARLPATITLTRTADILPHPVLLEQFTRKVEALRSSLDGDAIRAEAAEVLATLIESVTIYPAGEHGPEAEVVAKVADLIGWATNDNAAPKGGASCSIAVVAGAVFDRRGTGSSMAVVAGTRISRERHLLAIAI